MPVPVPGRLSRYLHSPIGRPPQPPASCPGGHERVGCPVLCAPRSVSVPSAVQHPLDAIGCRWFTPAPRRMQALLLLPAQRPENKRKGTSTYRVSRLESEVRTSFVLRRQTPDVPFPSVYWAAEGCHPRRPAEKGNLQPLTASPASPNPILHFQWHNPPVLGL